MVVDAGLGRRSPAADPTGTLPLQRRFRTEMRARWDRVRRLIPDMVAQRVDALSTVGHAALTGQDPTRAFQSWFDESLRLLVLGQTGAWVLSYVRAASDVAVQRSQTLTGSARPSQRDRTPILQSLCVTELQGIMEAVSQQAVRAFVAGLLNKQTPSAVGRAVQQVIDVVAKPRSDMLVSFIVVRTHAATTLDVYRAAGVPAVGVYAERVLTTPTRTRDAKPSAKKSKSKGSGSDDLVEVLTAGDDDVCPECQDISDEGPYSLDEAEDLIPAHPNCRCAFVPWDDERFASVHDEFNPDQPRDDTGKWTAAAWLAHQKAKKEAALKQTQRDDRETWAGTPGLASWKPPSDNGWRSVVGQNHHIHEPPLPDLKQKSYFYVDKATGETKTVQPPDKRMSSGVIMRESDGRVWVVKPKNGYGGYNYTFPKGGVEDDLHPQANAIKETYEESGLKARIVGYAGDYHGDTSITRMYHAVREDGHPGDHGWETESVALVHPRDMKKYLNRLRDIKIAQHHLTDEQWNESDHPRDKDGKFTFAGNEGAGAEGAKSFAASLEEGDVPHVVEHGYLGLQNASAVKVPKQHDLSSLEGNAASISGYSHKADLGTHNAYVFGHPDSDEDIGYGDKIEHDLKRGELPAHAQLDMGDMVKVGEKMGSNTGGVYEESITGNKYYIKKPQTKDHVQNELVAAALYKLAGVKTLNYVPVKGGEHVATELETLDKKNVKDLDLAERDAAKSDFAIHAWLANWDSVGTGGDNVGMKDGHVVTIDTGGSLKYRAQGEPKGAAFGDHVTETDTLRDPSKNPDAAKLYGDMTNEQMVASIKRVTSLSNQDISTAIYANMTGASYGDKAAMVDKLIARKNDLAKQAIKMSVAHPDATPYPGFKTVTGTADPTPLLAEPKVFKTKMEHAKHLLMKGTTSEELKKALNWPAIGVPKTAADLNLNLTKTKMPGGAFHYKGTPMTPQEIAAKKSGGKASAAEIKVAPTVPAAPMEITPAMKAAGVDKVLAKHTAPATPDELKKAQKNTKLTAQYVPGAPVGHPEAEKLIAAFNTKYEGKVIIEPAELQKKVDDFKALTAAMIPFMTEQQKVEAAKLAKQQAENLAAQEKIKAAQAAAKAAEEAKMNDPEVKKHYEVLAGIGAGKGYESTEAFIKKHNLNITPQQGAYIRAYVGSHYGPVNDQLRKGVLSIQQAKYAKALNEALNKMPHYVGTVYRGASISDADFDKYANAVGNVKIETQFTSAGVKGKLWGETTFNIESKTAADIRAFNPGEGGGEVVFKSGTHFHVTKVDKNKKIIWMEEIE